MRAREDPQAGRLPIACIGTLAFLAGTAGTDVVSAALMGLGMLLVLCSAL